MHWLVDAHESPCSELAPTNATPAALAVPEIGSNVTSYPGKSPVESWKIAVHCAREGHATACSH